MALRQRLTEMKGKGKYLFENTRYKIRQYRLTRGSSRTEEIFGMHWTTKLFITLLVLILLVGMFYAGKTLLVKKEQPVEQVEENVEEAAEALAAEPASLIEQEEMVPEEADRAAKFQQPEPSIDEEKEQLREEVQQLRRQKESFSPLLVDEGELAETAPLTLLPEPFDVQNMRAACQVDIRDEENDLAGAAQFFKEANKSYAAALEQIRDPANSLREAVEKLKAAHAELNAKTTTCVAEAPEQEPEPVPEPTPEPSPETPLENQTNETTS